MFCLCSSQPMRSASFAAGSSGPFAPRFGLADLGIPSPPRAMRRARPAEPAWREAMRWTIIGLSASLVAGEVALWLAGF
jgi:hypothetical protein